VTQHTQLSCGIATLMTLSLSRFAFMAAEPICSAPRDVEVGGANEAGSWYVMAGGVSLLSGLLVALR
jgi:hypothetical protein